VAVAFICGLLGDSKLRLHSIKW